VIVALLPLAAMLTVSQLAATTGADTLDASPLASSVLSGMEISPEVCPGALRRGLDDDRVAVCGTWPGDLGRIESRLARALVSPNHYRYRPVKVQGWRDDGQGWNRTAYWLGESSLEVLAERDGRAVAVVVSRPYPRCGDAVPILPRTGASGEIEVEPPLLLTAEDYPDRAARERIDGAVNLALLLTREGDSRILCIHHATPSGYGFELPAIEAARLISTGGARRARDTIVSVVVRFSKAAERRRHPHPHVHGTDPERLDAATSDRAASVSFAVGVP